MRTLPSVVAGGLSFSMGTCKRSSMAYDASSWEFFSEKCISCGSNEFFFLIVRRSLLNS